MSQKCDSDFQLSRVTGIDKPGGQFDRQVQAGVKTIRTSCTETPGDTVREKSELHFAILIIIERTCL